MRYKFVVYTKCPLYGLKSKKVLKRLLFIEDEKYFKQEYVSSLISPYIDNKEKPRLIEPPREDLKRIQKRIKNFLGRIEIPENVFSGIKGRSYIDNAKFHSGPQIRNIYKVDITAFFPSISREKVYNFFKDELCCEPDIAEILTNLTTVDLDKANVCDPNSIDQFLINKKIKCRNHLISGAPTSQILSYLANKQMFDELQKISDNYHATMTIYVDDITFSTENNISGKFKQSVQKIIKKYNYQISKKKTKWYSKNSPKLITGAVINSNGKLIIRNALSKKVIEKLKQLKENPDDYKCRQQLQGLLSAARQIDSNAFPSIYKYVMQKS